MYVGRGGGGDKFTPPYNLPKYFSKLYQTWQFGSISDEEQKIIYEFVVFVMTSSYFIADVIKNQHFQRIMGKSVYLPEFLS